LANSHVLIFLNGKNLKYLKTVVFFVAVRILQNTWVKYYEHQKTSFQDLKYVDFGDELYLFHEKWF